ncbi:MAG: cytochrome c family protein [Rhodobacteraceae bacterium]|nr:cytochrome c family protein [Paracoccaceae bacterium]
MFDTMTLTKALGGFCGAFLVFLLGKWAAEELYHTGGGHGYGDHAQAYVIEVEEPEAEEEEAEEVDLVALLASADPEKGAKVFGKCKSCHKLEDGVNGTGPHLYGVVDRAVGSVDGYGYSGALVAVADNWGYDELNGFFENPKKYAPGTKMSFGGLKKQSDRVNLIAYLETIGN